MTATIELRRTFQTQDPDENDLLIRERVMTAFQDSGYHRLCRISCHVYDGVVDLGGQVSSFHLKQVAQSLVLRIKQVRAVRNAIHVA